MNLPRLWRTVKYLSAEQWVYRFICRGARARMGLFPNATRKRIVRAANALPMPRADTVELQALAKFVLLLQRTVHGDDPSGVRVGKFSLLNQDFEFGSADQISWRGEFHEGNNPLRRMNLAYMGYVVPLLAEGKEGDLDIVCGILDGLEEQNPWSAPGVFRDVWNAYTASHRMINLLSGLSLFRQASATPDAKNETRILEHVRLCTAFIRENLERDLQYNHLLKNYVALTVFSAAAGGLPSGFEFLPKALRKSVAQNILPDGGHAERCPMYHVLSILDFEVLCASGVFDDQLAILLADTKSAMAHALLVMSHPDGDVALFNDSWIGEAPPAAQVVDFDKTPETIRLPEAGYVRLGRDGDVVIFDCGLCGPDDNPGHAHADFLSVETSVGGHRLIVDPAIPTYTAGELRDVSRSAASHNGPHLAGVEPIEFWKSFRVGRRGRAVELTSEALAEFAPIWCAGRHDGYAHVGGDTRRYIALWPGAAMLICDVMQGNLTAECMSNFLVPQTWEQTATDVLSFSQNDDTVSVEALVGELSVRGAGRYWPRFGVETPAHNFSISPAENGERRQSALWLSWSDTAAPPKSEDLSGLFDTLSAC
ncbi:MAG: hypothetical protein GKS01_08405 [Alphaproteobacteria bacterium]|nr:hypothetical protein [Alphaproteobacteria bacterium]